MKSKGIFILSLVFAVAVILLLTVDTSHDNKLFSFELESPQGKESISYWNGDNENIYVFMPSYSDLAQLKVDLLTDTEICINNVQLTDDMVCSVFSLDIPYELRYSNQSKTITFTKSSNVATMYVDTLSGNMDYIHNDKGNNESGEVRLYTSSGELDYSGTVDSISGRGNNTWVEFDKKPYNIDLSAPGDLLGMGSAKRWILIANAADLSNLRNKTVFNMAEKLRFSFVPQSQWIDLYLNGEYSGLYLLCERNEIHPERINISADNGVLVSKELEDKLNKDKQLYVKTDNNQFLRVHYPDSPADSDLLNISRLWKAFENALLAEDGIDPESGRHWREIIDVDSWARKFLIDEVFGNYDACLRSQFFYFDLSEEEPVIFADLVWDYDHSMGSGVFWQTSNPRSFFANRYEVNDSQTALWFYSLYNKEEFFEVVVDIYENEMKPLLEGMLSDELYSSADYISDASRLNLIRWGVNADNTSQNVDNIHSFMSERIDFLDKVYLEEKTFCLVVADASVGSNYAYYALEPGEVLYSIPVLQGDEGITFDGWYYSDTDEPVDVNKPVYEDTRIYAKWINRDANKMNYVILAAFIMAMGIFFMVFFVLDYNRNKGKRVNCDEPSKAKVSP